MWVEFYPGILYPSSSAMDFLVFQEIAKLEKKMENEKLRVEQLAMQLKLTIDDLNDKNEILKVLGHTLVNLNVLSYGEFPAWSCYQFWFIFKLQDIKEEKETLEADLASVKNALVTAESKLEWERQCNSLRLRHAELQNLSVKVCIWDFLLFRVW